MEKCKIRIQTVKRFTFEGTVMLKVQFLEKDMVKGLTVYILTKYTLMEPKCCEGRLVPKWRWLPW